MALTDIPPQRRARTVPGRKPRQPKLKQDEKAAVTEEARKLAEQVNAELEEIREDASRKYSPEDRRRANQRRQKQRARKLKREGKEPPKCKGYTWKGTLCELPPLIPENWEGPNEITGLYCVHHEPNITRDETEAFLLHGSPNKPVPRKITPGELAHVLVQRSPHAILKPYLKALGLELTDDGELVPKGTGLKLYGYSRGGEVVRSSYQDLVGQVQVAEKLFDRIYGKPRQAVDLASTSTSVSVTLNMDIQRVSSVAEVLFESGALPLPTQFRDGNGNGHVINGEARELESGLEEVEVGDLEDET